MALHRAEMTPSGTALFEWNSIVKLSWMWALLEKMKPVTDRINFYE